VEGESGDHGPSYDGLVGFHTLLCKVKHMACHKGTTLGRGAWVHEAWCRISNICEYACHMIVVQGGMWSWTKNYFDEPSTDYLGTNHLIYLFPICGVYSGACCLQEDFQCSHSYYMLGNNYGNNWKPRASSGPHIGSPHTLCKAPLYLMVSCTHVPPPNPPTQSMLSWSTWPCLIVLRIMYVGAM
jgi:hypothetical protein